MSSWLLVLYAFATLLALRTLGALIDRHRRRHRQRLVREYLEVQRRARAAARKAAEPPPASQSPKAA